MFTYSLRSLFIQSIYFIPRIWLGVNHSSTTFFWWLVYLSHYWDQLGLLFRENHLVHRVLAEDLQRRLAEVDQLANQLEIRALELDGRLAELTQLIEEAKLTRLDLDQFLQIHHGLPPSREPREPRPPPQ